MDRRGVVVFDDVLDCGFEGVIEEVRGNFSEEDNASVTTTAFSCRLPFNIFTKKAICSSFTATAIFVMRALISSVSATTAFIARSMPPSSARSFVPAAVTKCVVAFMLVMDTDSVFSVCLKEARSTDPSSFLRGTLFWMVRQPISKVATSVDCDAVGTDALMLCSTKEMCGRSSGKSLFSVIRYPRPIVIAD